MSSIRLSPDVEEAARQLSDELGLGGTKTAIEAVFRTQWRRYRDRGAGGTSPSQVNAYTSPQMLSVGEDVDAVADLDSVM